MPNLLRQNSQFLEYYSTQNTKKLDSEFNCPAILFFEIDLTQWIRRTYPTMN